MLYVLAPFVDVVRGGFSLRSSKRSSSASELVDETCHQHTWVCVGEPIRRVLDCRSHRVGGALSVLVGQARSVGFCGEEWLMHFARREPVVAEET
jgi:hypothetical protein